MLIKNGNKLKTVYYRFFLFLIVIPILLIITITLGLLRRVVLDSSIGKIKLAQENVSSTLTNEIRDVSLRLSHFVHVNNNQILALASLTDTGDIIEKYRRSADLTSTFNFAMVPVRSILSVKFYMKNGSDIYLKNDVILARQSIMADDWYRNALAHKNRICIGGYNSQVLFAVSLKNEFTIVAGLSPDMSTDRSEKIELAALFAVSDIGKMISAYNRQRDLGVMYLFDINGCLLFNAGEAVLPVPGEIFKGVPCIVQEKFKGVRHTVISTIEPETGWRIVSAVNSHVLFRPFTSIIFGVICVTLLLLSLFYLFSRYFLRNIIDPVYKMADGLHKIGEGNLDIRIQECGQAELRILIRSFNEMTGRLKAVIAEKNEEQHKKYEAELRSLQSQINPHFLVNTLNSIRFMAQVSRFDGIRNMAEALIKILSTSFRSSEGFYSVSEELEVLRSYVFLMKIRYSEGFDMEYTVDPKCLDFLVPRLILQPIVENSIVHGVSGIEKRGVIHLTIYLQGSDMCFEIADNGQGMTDAQLSEFRSGNTPEKQEYTSIGMSNVNSRLKLNYGNEYGLHVFSVQGEGTRTVIRIPAAAKKEDMHV